MAPAMIAQILNVREEIMRALENAANAGISQNTATHTARVHTLVLTAEQKPLAIKTQQLSPIRWVVLRCTAVLQPLDRVELRQRKKARCL
jgi:hypothetical protein